MHKNRKDLSKRSFGDWTVLHLAPSSKSGHTNWFCECKCGNICSVSSVNLTSGKSKGCKNCASKNHCIHSMSKSPTYSVYVQMIERCHNESHASYHRYGARGIHVCERWRNGFIFFLEDMGEAPYGMSIERINNNLGYSKHNCKWENWKNQCRNKENSIRDGDIYHGWKVISKIPNQKKYVLECVKCGFNCIIWSCNVRRKKPHLCLLKGNNNENL